LAVVVQFDITQSTILSEPPFPPALAIPPAQVSAQSVAEQLRMVVCSTVGALLELFKNMPAAPPPVVAEQFSITQSNIFPPPKTYAPPAALPEAVAVQQVITQLVSNVG
jgi:hypothetical protein